MSEPILYQFSTTTVIALLAVFYIGTFLLTLFIGKGREDADAYMVSNRGVGFGVSAASMTATWIWAASFYAAATSGYTYGLSGPLHYGMWGALMILFIYPFGIRIRKLAPEAHTLAEVIHARHGTSSQMILAFSNLLGSLISLMVNFTAAGALVAVLSPLSFQHGVLIAGIGVLCYTIWSGFRAAVLTDVVHLTAMMAVAVVIIPMVLFAMGGPGVLVSNMSLLTPEQSNFFSREAILEQGAPFFIAVLAYAIGNQTISQRLFAVRQDMIKPTFITATVGYGAIVIGLGMIGLMAALVGLEPMDGNLNNIIPQVVSTYLSPFMIGLFFILVIGSLSSTADSDLSALSSIVMTDVYGKHLSKGDVDPRKMLLFGRITMIIATMAGIIMASFSLNILVMVVFVGALWGAIVFPVIASIFWGRVTNAAFTWAVAAGLVTFAIARFELLPMTGAIGVFFELVAAAGAGVVIGLMTFAFLGFFMGLFAGIVATVAAAWFGLGELHHYTVLMASLTAYGMSTLVCLGLTLLSRQEDFNFQLIQRRVGDFDDGADDADALPQGASSSRG